jgi:hypothetical protein
MTDLSIRDDLALRLQHLAEQENRSVNDVLRTMLDVYSPPAASQTGDAPLDAFIGAFDDDVGEFSSTIRESMEQYYRRKYDRPD